MAILGLIALWPLLHWLRARWRMHRAASTELVTVTSPIERKAKA
jgi:hypothetical protein